MDRQSLFISVPGQTVSFYWPTHIEGTPLFDKDDFVHACGAIDVSRHQILEATWFICFYVGGKRLDCLDDLVNHYSDQNLCLWDDNQGPDEGTVIIM